MVKHHTFPAADARYPSSVSGAENIRSASSIVQTCSGQILRWSKRNGCIVAEALLPAWIKRKKGQEIKEREKERSFN